MMNELIEKYEAYRKEIKSLGYAFYLIEWDSETEAPTGSFESRAGFVETLSTILARIERSDDYINTVKELYNHYSELDMPLKEEIRRTYKTLMQSIKVPEKESIAYSTLLATSQYAWAKAKNANDYSIFAPVLEEIIAYNKRLVKYLETPDLSGYDVLLDMYEEGMTKEKYDVFFKQLKESIVPLVKEINKVQTKIPSFATAFYPKEKQKQIAEYIMDVMCFDRNRGLMKESEHPFTSGSGTTDVRVTNHYYENLFISSIFSIIHELGHGTYEQQCDPALDKTNLSGGTTMAMHESQSRFYENIIGRSKEFWDVHYPKLKEIFKDELENVTLDDFYQLINRVECSLIRTEADELTYPLHIMVRYEIEKEIIEGNISVYELPKRWNELYKEYLGVDVPSDRLGILQDIHWAGGSFGYFPTYALGSAYAAQLLNEMEKDICIKEVLKSKTTKEINEWLKEKVHKFGGTLLPQEILKNATGESFNPSYYIEYLTKKYKELYHLK